MKAEELRIGNCIIGVYNDFSTEEEIEKTTVCEVDIIDSTRESGYNIWASNLEGLDIEEYNEFIPIPLTEEWLLKFGFEKNENEIYILQLHYDFYLYFNLDHLVGGLATEENEGNYEIVIVDDIKYVHQIQNLYFALKGKELEIK